AALHGSLVRDAHANVESTVHRRGGGLAAILAGEVFIPERKVGTDAIAELIGDARDDRNPGGGADYGNVVSLESIRKNEIVGSGEIVGDSASDREPLIAQRSTRHRQIEADPVVEFAQERQLHSLALITSAEGQLARSILRHFEIRRAQRVRGALVPGDTRLKAVLEVEIDAD